MQRFMAFVLLFVWVICASVCADQPTPEPTTQPEQRARKRPATTKESEEPVVTEHQTAIAGARLKYKTTAGFIPLKDSAGKPRAKVFFMAYDKALDEESQRKDRPITFVFN